MKSRLKIKVLKAGGVYDPRGKEFNSFGARKSIQRAKSKGEEPFPF